jgi:hypothetical protein
MYIGHRLNLESHVLKVETATATEFHCAVCGKVGGRKDNILNHLENRHFPGNYGCLLCEKVFRSVNTLQVHMSRLHGGGGDNSRRGGVLGPF